LAAGLFSIEAPIWRTVKHLTVKPHQLLWQYLHGKRKTYYKPVSFFILTSALYLLVRWAINFDILSDSTITVGNVGDGEMLTSARSYMLLHIDKLLIFYVLSMALLLKLFFYKRYLLAEYFAVAFFMVGFYMLLATLNIVFITYSGSTNQSLALVLMGVYFVVAMTMFFKRPKFWIALKAFFVYMIGATIYLLLAFGFSYLMVVINRL
jgi:hypothetical protein